MCCWRGAGIEQKKLAGLLATQKQKDNAAGPAAGGPGAPGGEAKEKEGASVAESERQYADTLNVIMDLRAKISRQRAEADVAAGELQHRLDDKQAKVGGWQGACVFVLPFLCTYTFPLHTVLIFSIDCC
jgi:hypothetical protein